MPKSPDDRDVRKPITPPMGVRAQTAQPESFEDETPVHGDPVTQLNLRARQAAHASRDAAASSKAAFAKIGEVQREVHSYVQRDLADHDRLFKSYDRLDEKIETQNQKIDKTNEIVSNVRAQVGTVIGQLTTLTGAIEDERKARVEQAKARLEVEKHEKITAIDVNKEKNLATIKDEQATAEFRRQKGLKVFGLLGTILTILAGLVAAIKC